MPAHSSIERLRLTIFEFYCNILQTLKLSEILTCIDTTNSDFHLEATVSKFYNNTTQTEEEGQKNLVLGATIFLK